MWAYNFFLLLLLGIAASHVQEAIQKRVLLQDIGTADDTDGGGIKVQTW